MLGHELERVLYKILSGKTLIKKFNLEVIAPNIDLLYEAEEIYCEFYNKKGTLNREELKEKLVQNRIISHTDIGYLKDFTKVLESLQEELFLNFHTINADPIRSLIKQARTKQEKILAELSRYESYSKEGLASYAKSIFIIKNTTYRNNKLYSFEDKSPVTVLSEFNLNSISNEIIRIVSRKSSWTNTWYGLKGSTIFQNIPTLEQQLLLMWSKIYDNIRESSEAPDNDIINDDDALDGWLIIQKRENEKQKKNNPIRTNSKINNSDEVFIIARTKEDIERVERLNDAQAARIKRDRMSQIYTQGKVDHHNLLDVRRDIQAQYHKMQVEHIKNANKN